MALYKRSRGAEPGTSSNKSSWWSEQGWNSGSSDFKSGARTTQPRWPRESHLNLKIFRGKSDYFAIILPCRHFTLLTKYARSGHKCAVQDHRENKRFSVVRSPWTEPKILKLSQIICAADTCMKASAFKLTVSLFRRLMQTSE